MAMDWGLVRPGPGSLPENGRGLVSTALGAAHSLAGDGSVLMSSCSFLEVSLKNHLPPSWGSVRLHFKPACSAYFFSWSSVFLSQHSSINSVFQRKH